MSDRQISVGDLVVVVRSHCAREEAAQLGLFRTVSWLDGGDNYQLRCRFCKGMYNNPSIAMVEPDGWHPTGWLKRIPPLSELEGVKTDEPIKEPA